MMRLPRIVGGYTLQEMCWCLPLFIRGADGHGYIVHRKQDLARIEP